MANPGDNAGLFLPSTYEFDIGALQDDVSSSDFKELIVRLYQNINSIVLALNLKETGFYVQTEFVTGKVWYPDPALNSTTGPTPELRQAYRVVVPFGALLNNATKSLVTDVQYPSTSPTTFRVKIIDCVANKITTPFAQVPIPYSSTLQPVPENIELWFDTVVIDANTVALRINIATTSVVTDWTAYTDVDVIIEFLRY